MIIIILSIAVGVLVALINNEAINTFLLKLPEWLNRKKEESSGGFKLFYRILSGFINIPDSVSNERVQIGLRAALTILFPFVAAFLIWLPAFGIFLKILPVFSSDAKKIEDAYEEGKRFGNENKKRN